MRNYTQGRSEQIRSALRDGGARTVLDVASVCDCTPKVAHANLLNLIKRGLVRKTERTIMELDRRGNERQAYVYELVVPEIEK